MEAIWFYVNKIILSQSFLHATWCMVMHAEDFQIHLGDVGGRGAVVPDMPHISQQKCKNSGHYCKGSRSVMGLSDCEY